MAIQSLESFLFERGLVGSLSIKQLKNSTLGIDVNHYISRLLNNKKEQFLDAIGGFPTSLELYLESDLKIFNDFNITPIFVFNGSLTINQLNYADHDNAGFYQFNSFNNNNSGNDENNNINSTNSNNNNNNLKTNKELMFHQRQKGWLNWINYLNLNQQNYIDQPLLPQEPFRLNSNFDINNRFQSDLIKFFIENDLNYIIAPFCSWINLNYFLQTGLIDAIYGPTDCLMLSNLDKFIIGLEFPNKEFRFIERKRILKELNISMNEFLDISMCCSNDLQPYVLPPLQIYPMNKLFEMALEMVLTTGTNFYAYQLSSSSTTNNNSNPLKNFEVYQMGMASLKNMPIIMTNGKMEIYNIDSEVEDKNSTPTKSTIGKSLSSRKASIPNDIHAFISQRLPDEYLFYKAIGLVNGKLFDAITTGVYPEEPPLDGGLSNSYRDMVVKSVDFFKNKEVNLLTQQINRYFQMKPIKHIKWYSLDNNVQLLNRTSPSIFDQLNNVVIKIDNDNTREFSLNEFINLINENKENLNSFIVSDVIFSNSVPVEKKLSSKFDLMSTNLLRLLIQIEFIDYDKIKKTMKLNNWGEALLDIAKFNSNELIENIFILLVFLKLKVLKISEEFKPIVKSSLSDHTLRTYPKESKHIMLLSRLLTISPIEQKPITNYNGPIDKQLLTFREHLHYVKLNLNEMFESLVINSLTNNEFNKLSLTSIVDWQRDIVGKMPFRKSLPNTIMPMMMEFFLQKYLHNGNSKADAINLVVTEFSTYKLVPNLNDQFTNCLNNLIFMDTLFENWLSLNIIDNEDFTQFHESVEFVKSALRE